MNLMFWKKEPATEDDAEDAQEQAFDRTESPKTGAREPGERDSSDDTDGETAASSPAHPKLLLILVAAMGMLVLAAIGIAIWVFFLSPPQQNTAAAVTPSSVQTMALPEKNLIKLPQIEFIQSRKASPGDRQAGIAALNERNRTLQTQIEALKLEQPRTDGNQSADQQAEIEALRNSNDELRTQIEALKAELPLFEKDQAERHQADIDALTKKNNELQAQIEALRKKLPQRPSTSPASRPRSQAQPPARSGDLAVDSKTPKAAAMTLKEAIEAMNAGSGEPASRPAK